MKNVFSYDMNSSEIIKSIDEFLLYGGDINAEIKGSSLLHRATHIKLAKTRNEVIEYLLDKSADVNLLNKRGRTPFFRILYYGNNELINKALDKGADVNVVDDFKVTIIERLRYSHTVSLKTIKRIIELVNEELITEMDFKIIIHNLKKRYDIEKIKKELTHYKLLRFWIEGI